MHCKIIGYTKFQADGNSLCPFWQMLRFIHDLAYFYDHHWPFQKPFLFLEREHQELTNCDMPCHLSVFKEKGKGKWQILLHILLLKYGIQNVQIYVCVWALEYDIYF